MVPFLIGILVLSGLNEAVEQRDADRDADSDAQVDGLLSELQLEAVAQKGDKKIQLRHFLQLFKIS